MPKDYFNVDHCVALEALKPTAKIHVIGVSGVAMAELSMALARAGYTVSGSDRFGSPWAVGSAHPPYD